MLDVKTVLISVGLFVAGCIVAIVLVERDGAQFRDRCEAAGGIAINATATDRDCINGERLDVDRSWF